MTITEALAEIKTVIKRIETKRKFVSQYLIRSDQLKDPHEKDGGSAKLVAQEMQAISDLEARVVELRDAIDTVNRETVIEIEGEAKTISEWLAWRREVAPNRERFLSQLQQGIMNVRDGLRRGAYGYPSEKEVKPQDMVVNFNEQELAKEVEKIKNILGQLDGQLSLKNATTMVEA